MAKQVKLAKGKEFSFKSAPRGGGGETKYPWDAWLSGELLLLEQSEGKKNDKDDVTEVAHKKDYDVGTNFMVPKLKTAARRRYKVVQISRVDADGRKLKNALIIKARDMTADERAAEDRLRAEEKVKFAKRRAEKKNGATSVAPAQSNPPGEPVTKFRVGDRVVTDDGTTGEIEDIQVGTHGDDTIYTVGDSEYDEESLTLATDTDDEDAA